MFDARLLDEPARQALRQASSELDAAERSAQPFAMSQALLQMARSHAALGAAASTEAYLELALRWARMTGSNDHIVDLLCELCEAAALLAEREEGVRCGNGHRARERARDHAFEASALAGRVADAGWEVQVLLRISDVLNRCGDHDDAAQLQTRAIRLMSGPEIGAAPNPAILPSLGRLADA